MQAIRRADTRLELRLRSLLHQSGLRYRKDFRVELPSGTLVRPDIVFTRRRIAVFVDSCFWHSCPVHGRQPAVHEWYWRPKLARTVERDRAADRALAQAGWTVIRVWEHDDLAEAAGRIARVVRARMCGAGAARSAQL
jgi:DNA mismatch endonuclease (patch repair protein)